MQQTANAVAHQKRPSLADIAERAGVSISTASKVANGQADVAPETRRRVEEILKESQYVSVKRRNRPQQLSVALLVRPSTWQYTIEVISGATVAAEAADVELRLTSYAEDGADSSWIDTLVDKNPSGVIAVTSVLNEEERRRFADMSIPLVVVDPFNVPDQLTQSVGATNWNGGLEATEHLLRLGHVRVGMLVGDKDALASRARAHGYVAALSGAGISVDRDLMIDGEFTFESGIQGADILLNLTDAPTAIFAASDLQALGVIEAARRRRIRVPEELSVVGFDDLLIARSSSPPLTTVRQPLAEMAQTALRMILATINGDSIDNHHTELATTLVIRDSTAPPHK